MQPADNRQNRAGAAAPRRLARVAAPASADRSTSSLVDLARLAVARANAGRSSSGGCFPGSRCASVPASSCSSRPRRSRPCGRRSWRACSAASRRVAVSGCAVLAMRCRARRWCSPASPRDPAHPDRRGAGSRPHRHRDHDGLHRDGGGPPDGKRPPGAPVADLQGVGAAARPRLRPRHRAAMAKASWPGNSSPRRTRLLPPPQPAWPGGYDFARDAYYRGIGAVGSVLGRVTALDPPVAAPPGRSASRRRSTRRAMR